MNKRKVNVTPELLMILPALALLALITIYPFIFTIWLSFMDYPMILTRAPSFCGFENWQRMFTDPKVKHYWIVTLKYAFGALSCEMVLGIFIALLLDKVRFLQDFFTTLTMFPLFFAPVLVGLLGRFLFHDSYGIYTYFLHRMGFFENISIFGRGNSALFALIFLDIWEWTPLIIIIVLAGLKALPLELFEVASVDGATGWQKLWYLTLPLLKPTIIIALLIRTMDVIKYFDQILITTRGGPADATKTISMAIYDQAFQAYQMGYAATLTLSALVITILLGMIFTRFLFAKEVQSEK